MNRDVARTVLVGVVFGVILVLPGVVEDQVTPTLIITSVVLALASMAADYLRLRKRRPHSTDA